jgi:hypothetical protein
MAHAEKILTFKVDANELSKMALHSGFMSKQDKKVGMIWRKRFCVLMYTSTNDTEDKGRYGIMYLFNNPDDKITKSRIDLRKTVEDIKIRKGILKIKLKSGRNFYFSCEKLEELDKWFKNLQDASKGTVQPDAYDANNYLLRSKSAHKIEHAHLRKRSTNVITRADNNPYPYVNFPMSSLISSSPTTQNAPSFFSASAFQGKSANSSIEVGKARRDLLGRSRIFSLEKPLNTSNELEMWMQWGKESMHYGSVVRKYPFLSGCSGRPKKRFIALSKDDQFIQWGTSKDLNQLNRKLHVSRVKQIIFGPYSLTMNRYAFNSSLPEELRDLIVPWRCISIVVTLPISTEENNERTIDLQFNSDTETLAWFVGLQSVCQSCSTVNIEFSQFKWVKLRLQMEEKLFRKSIEIEENGEENYAALSIGTIVSESLPNNNDHN